MNNYLIFKRYAVPINKIQWDKHFALYTPTNFTSDKIKDRKAGATYKDPDV